MLELPREYVEIMAVHAQDEAPNECFGIIAGEGGRAVAIYPMTKGENSPYHYKPDLHEFMRIYFKEIEKRGREFLAFYHSHLDAPPYPSDTDVRQAHWPDGTTKWPDAFDIIISLADPQQTVMRAFRIVDGAVTEAELRIAP